MALQEKLGFAQLTGKQQELDLQRQLGLGGLELQQQQLSTTTQSNQFGQQLQYAQFMAGVDQAFPGGVQTGYSKTKAMGGKNPYEMSQASDVYGKMLQQPAAYTPTYTSLAKSNINQARGIYY
jgi:hypothetical protein